MTDDKRAHDGDPRRAAAVIAGNPSVSRTELQTADYQALRRLLAAEIRRIGYFAAADADDCADEAILKFAQAAAKGRVHAETALSYARRVARNEAIDRSRRRAREVVGRDVEPVAKGDDEVARLIDYADSAMQLETALRLAAQNGDSLCVAAAREFLKLYADGDTPSWTEIGRRLGVSGNGAKKAFERLKNYIAEVP